MLWRLTEQGFNLFGLSEGAVINAGGYEFSIHYQMGAGENIIGLTLIPELRAMALLAGVLCLCVCALRRKR